MSHITYIFKHINISYVRCLISYIYIFKHINISWTETLSALVISADWLRCLWQLRRSTFPISMTVLASCALVGRWQEEVTAGLAGQLVQQTKAWTKPRWLDVLDLSASSAVKEIISVIWRRFEGKIVLCWNYLTYHRKTNPSMFPILPTVKWTKFHLASALIIDDTIFGYVIYSQFWPCRSVRI